MCFENSITLCNSEYNAQTGFPVSAKRVSPWKRGDYFYAEFDGGIIVIETSCSPIAFSYSEGMSIAEFKSAVNTGTFVNYDVCLVRGTNKHLGVDICRMLK